MTDFIPVYVNELPDWWWDGLCAETDPEAFYPEKGGTTEPAKRICARCPVIAQCLDHALATDEPHGIWGGMSARERRRLLRALPEAG